MQVSVPQKLKSFPHIDEARAALGKCVHCGMCNATCPTYQLTGDELDGPRGRIYLIKGAIEGHAVTSMTQQHLDRCLTCRNCETTCPSNVPYAQLAEVGREVIEHRLSETGSARPLTERMMRWTLREGLTRPKVFSMLLAIGRKASPLLPGTLRKKLPPVHEQRPFSPKSHAREMIMLDGCVQPSLDASINDSAERVLDQVGISCSYAPRAGCCGAIRTHLGDRQGGLNEMRRNIDAWTPLLDAGAEALISTASGCGQMIKEYGHYLKDDPEYADRAKKVSAAVKDISEVLYEHREELGAIVAKGDAIVAYHPPCTLQHGLRVRGKAESILEAVGATVKKTADSHLCCGSAGTYSITQPTLAKQLRDDKLEKLEAFKPDAILTANIGCQCHLQSGTENSVRHWISWLDQALSDGRKK